MELLLANLGCYCSCCKSGSSRRQVGQLHTLNLTDNRIGDAGRATLLAALGAEHADADGCSLPPLEVLRIDKSNTAQEEALF